jgi:hypothetical protein
MKKYFFPGPIFLSQYIKGIYPAGGREESREEEGF